MPNFQRARYTRTAIDLFAGCGGLTEGLKLAGFQVLGAVEIDKIAAQTYHLNHPEVTLWTKDVRCLSPREVERKLKLKAGQLDLLAGCPPCQGFSKMRTLNGKRSNRDKRNDLLFEIVRFAKSL